MTTTIYEISVDDWRRPAREVELSKLASVCRELEGIASYVIYGEGERLQFQSGINQVAFYIRLGPTLGVQKIEADVLAQLSAFNSNEIASMDQDIIVEKLESRLRSKYPDNKPVLVIDKFHWVTKRETALFCRKIMRLHSCFYVLLASTDIDFNRYCWDRNLVLERMLRLNRNVSNMSLDSINLFCLISASFERIINPSHEKRVGNSIPERFPLRGIHRAMFDYLLNDVKLDVRSAATFTVFCIERQLLNQHEFDVDWLKLFIYYSYYRELEDDHWTKTFLPPSEITRFIEKCRQSYLVCTTLETTIGDCDDKPHQYIKRLIAPGSSLTMYDIDCLFPEIKTTSKNGLIPLRAIAEISYVFDITLLDLINYQYGYWLSFASKRISNFCDVHAIPREQLAEFDFARPTLTIVQLVEKREVKNCLRYVRQYHSRDVLKRGIYKPAYFHVISKVTNTPFLFWCIVFLLRNIRAFLKAHQHGMWIARYGSRSSIPAAKS